MEVVLYKCPEINYSQVLSKQQVMAFQPFVNYLVARSFLYSKELTVSCLPNQVNYIECLSPLPGIECAIVSFRASHMNNIQ